MTRVARDDGAAAVEFALVALIMVMIVMGAVDFGMGAFDRSRASEAAREASRVAMLTKTLTTGPVTSGSIFGAAVARLGTKPSTLSVSVSCLDTTGAASTCAQGNYVAVTVKWHRDPLTFVGIGHDISATSSRQIVGMP